MAFSAGNGSFSGGRRVRVQTGTLSEINVVPLVDVVLVLLIIFMLTAHVMEFGLEVDVPKVVEVRETAEELPVVTLTRNGEIFLADKPVNINSLGEEIRRRSPRQNAVYLRGDKNTILDVVAQVASALGQAKFGIRLVTQPIDESETPRR